jgi:hypothetical protein
MTMGQEVLTFNVSQYPMCQETNILIHESRVLASMIANFSAIRAKP